MSKEPEETELPEPADPLMIVTISLDPETGAFDFDGGDMSEGDVFMVVWQAWDLLLQRNRLSADDDDE